jgi:hypothetical protein
MIPNENEKNPGGVRYPGMTNMKRNDSANNATTVVRRSTQFDLVEDTRVSRVDADLRYQQDDPYAVTFVFRTTPDSSITWSFARDLLAEGLDYQVGEGDVRIGPATFPTGNTSIKLGSPEGRVELSIATATLAEFLSATYRLVAPGQESGLLGVDAGLAQLLGSEIS